MSLVCNNKCTTKIDIWISKPETIISNSVFPLPGTRVIFYFSNLMLSKNSIVTDYRGYEDNFNWNHKHIFSKIQTWQFYLVQLPGTSIDP